MDGFMENDDLVVRLKQEIEQLNTQLKELRSERQKRRAGARVKNEQIGSLKERIAVLEEERTKRRQQAKKNGETIRHLKECVNTSYGEILKWEFPFLGCDPGTDHAHIVRPTLSHVSIIGQPCSGTTIMGKALGRHPDVFDTCDPDKPLPTELKIRDKNPFESFLYIHSPEIYTDRKILEILHALEKLAGADRKTHVLEKTPLHLFATERISRLIPQIKFVCMIRDGRDQVVSAMRAFNRPKELAVQDYIRRAKRIMELETKLKNMILVRLEDFTATPEEKTSEILRFLELNDADDIVVKMLSPLDESAVGKTEFSVRSNYTLDGVNAARPGGRPLIQKIRLEQRRQPIIKDTSRWHELSDEEQEKIFPAIKPYLEHFGYLGAEETSGRYEERRIA